MLTDDVGRGRDLKRVLAGMVGRSIGVREFDAHAGIGAEEKRIGGASAPLILRDVIRQDIDARLFVVPAILIYHQIEFDRGNIVAPGSGRE